MEETSTAESISMQAAPRVSSGKSRESRPRQGSSIPRPAYVAITFVLILTIGWGAYSIIGRQSHSDEDAELADLEGFEEEAPSLGTPDPQSTPQSRSLSSRDFSSRTFGERANPWQTAPAPGANAFPALFASPDTPLARFERTPFAEDANNQSTSGAWLIGTIEADDAPERIALPPRVSQAVADGPLFR
ncbi:MAG: hypothetical protein AABP62_11040 [Planctomycetota bacterium]